MKLSSIYVQYQWCVRFLIQLRFLWNVYTSFNSNVICVEKYHYDKEYTMSTELCLSALAFVESIVAFDETKWILEPKISMPLKIKTNHFHFNHSLRLFAGNPFASSFSRMFAYRNFLVNFLCIKCVQLIILDFAITMTSCGLEAIFHEWFKWSGSTNSKKRKTTKMSSYKLFFYECEHFQLSRHRLHCNTGDRTKYMQNSDILLLVKSAVQCIRLCQQRMFNSTLVSASHDVLFIHILSLSLLSYFYMNLISVIFIHRYPLVTESIPFCVESQVHDYRRLNFMWNIFHISHNRVHMHYYEWIIISIPFQHTDTHTHSTRSHRCWLDACGFGKFSPTLKVERVCVLVFLPVAVVLCVCVRRYSSIFLRNECLVRLRLLVLRMVWCWDFYHLSAFHSYIRIRAQSHNTNSNEAQCVSHANDNVYLLYRYLYDSIIRCGIASVSALLNHRLAI